MRQSYIEMRHIKRYSLNARLSHFCSNTLLQYCLGILKSLGYF